jgi:pilus assembly protein Flp/PilA
MGYGQNGEKTMERLKNLIARLVRDDQGQDLIEYALLATFVALVAIVGAQALGTSLNSWYDTVSGNVDAAAGSAS